VDLGAGALTGTPGAGGYFQVNTGLTITCDHIRATNAILLRTYHAAGATVVVNADIIGSAVYGVDTARVYAGGGITVNGDLTGGTGGSGWGLNVQIAGDPITVNGNLYAASASSGMGLFSYAARAVVVNGDVYGSETHLNSNGGYFFLATSLTITGDIYARMAPALYLGPPVDKLARIIGNVQGYDDGDPITGVHAAGILTQPGVTVLVSGLLIPGAQGSPAVGGRVLLDPAYPMKQHSVWYMAPDTGALTSEVLRRKGPQISGGR